MWTPVYYVRLVSLPTAVDGVSVPNDDGSFDIYINANHCEARRQECLEHELEHIREDHFYQETKAVAQLEQEAKIRQPSPPVMRLPDVFKECSSDCIPCFASLKSFGNYMFAMREQVQSDMRRSAG